METTGLSEEEETLLQYFVPDETGRPMMQTEILQFLQSRTSYRLNSRSLSTALKKKGFLRKSIRQGHGSRYVYLVRELTDHDRVIEEQKIKSELIGNDAIHRLS